MNTPTLKTNRLILRKFTDDDISALFDIYKDKEVNAYLPWFPLHSIQEAEALFETHYKAAYLSPIGYQYAICLKEDNIPIGYIKIDTDDSYDLGYGLRKEFWRRGIVSEAGKAIIAQVKKDRIPYLTATHDVNNLHSGYVLQSLGLDYKYSYKELWQPKNIPVIFRMYQLNLDGNTERIYLKYWNQYEEHFIEELHPCPLRVKSSLSSY